jgi:iron only hydrogenase large subunit-like protein/Ni,Fe-hydrogenase III small subunit
MANLEEEILEVVGMVELVSFREVMKEHSDHFDIAFVEGSICRPMDEAWLKTIRKNAKILIALGDCATCGGVNKLRNDWPGKEVLGLVYPDAGPAIDGEEFFDIFPVKALDEVVEVDFKIRGCPVRKERVLYYIERLCTMPPHPNLELRFDIVSRELEEDRRSIIQYDPRKCILCRHCDTICNDILNVHAIGLTNKGNDTIISTPFDIGLDDNKCISCGQCIVNCPVGAFTPVSSVEAAMEIMDDPDNFVVFAIDPVAVASATEMMATQTTGLGQFIGSLITALRDQNVSKVIDFTHFRHLSIAAQSEFVGTHDEMTIASWCPGAHAYVEKLLPDLRGHIHRETSPEDLLLQAVRSWYPHGNLKIVLLTPCVALKSHSGFDAVLTATELPRLLRSRGIDLDFHDWRGASFDCGLNLSDQKVRGASGDHTYSLPILETAYLGRFNKLDARLVVNPVGEYCHELVYDSDEGFFNALVIDDIARGVSHLREDLGKYNVVEFFPCPRGCLTGGGQVPTTSVDRLARRSRLLEEYWDGRIATDRFLSRILSAYNELKGVC